jgi:hypothetical protein
MTKEELIASLGNSFPYANTKFIEVLADAIELHNSKNHDYRGGKKTYEHEHDDFEKIAMFLDIRRKYSRLENIVKGNKALVDETILDTAIDLGVYAFLFAAYLREEKNEQGIL